MGKFKKGEGGYWAGKSRKGLPIHPSVDFKCAICGTPFKRSYYAYRKGLEDPKMMPKFCSRKCQLSNNKFRVGKAGNQTAFKSQDKRLVGKSNPNWKGGVSPLAEKIRRLVPYIEWRTKVFVRDDYTCRICGGRGGELNADHYPVMFFEIIEKYHIDSVEKALACEALWTVNNAQTLCQKCHREKTITDMKYAHTTFSEAKKKKQQSGLNRSGGASGRKWKTKVR